MGAWISTLVALTSLALGPDGKPGVAVLSVDGVSVPSAFVESMRIQLTSMASVETGPVISGHSRAEKVAQARRYLVEVGASIAVWEERLRHNDVGAEVVVVVAVTSDPKSESIEVAELTTTGGPEDDRVLALKVAELLYQALSVANSERELADELASRGLKPDSEIEPRPPRLTPAPPPPRSLAPRPSAAPHNWAALVEAGGGLRVDSRFSAPQVTGNLALALGYRSERVSAELGIVAQVLTQRELHAENGGLVLVERHVGGSLRGLFNTGPLAVGAHFDVVAAFVSATATAVDGRQGSAVKVGTGWAIGPEGRLRLAPRLEMRALLALETTLYAQRFAIEGVRVTDRGVGHRSAQLSLIFSVP